MSSAGEGAHVLALLTGVFLIGTIAGMAVFTTLARAGASVLRLERWARYEGAVLGLALIAPNAVYERIYTLPLMTISMTKGTLAAPHSLV